MNSSLSKGKAGEREFCQTLSGIVGHQCLTRNLEQWRSGGHDLTAIQSDNCIDQRLSRFAIEIKRHRSGRDADIEKWWQQAVRQAIAAEKKPMLAYRFDRQKWHCMLHLSEFPTDDIRGCITIDIELFAKLIKEGGVQCAL